MDHNLFAQIESVNKKLLNPIAIPQLISKDDTTITSSSSSSSTLLSKSYNIPSSSYSSSYLPSSLSVSNSTKEDYPFCIAVTSADANTDTSSIFGTKFIEFTILIVRNIDGETKVVKKRYKDLLYYYQQLVANEIITNHDDINFPERNSFAPADPNTPFIKKRMIDLQIFFQKLFTQNPQLHFLPLTIEFFEIEAIVLNTVTSSNTNITTTTTTTTSNLREKIQSQDNNNTTIKSQSSYTTTNYNSNSIFGSITTFNSSFEKKNNNNNNDSKLKSKYDL